MLSWVQLEHNPFATGTQPAAAHSGQGPRGSMGTIRSWPGIPAPSDYYLGQVTQPSKALFISDMVVMKGTGRMAGGSMMPHV